MNCKFKWRSIFKFSMSNNDRNFNFRLILLPKVSQPPNKLLTLPDAVHDCEGNITPHVWSKDDVTPLTHSEEHNHSSSPNRNVFKLNYPAPYSAEPTFIQSPMFTELSETPVEEIASHREPRSQNITPSGLNTRPTVHEVHVTLPSANNEGIGRNSVCP